MSLLSYSKTASQSQSASLNWSALFDESVRRSHSDYFMRVDSSGICFEESSRLVHVS